MTLPDVVTHYYLASRRPFQNLSELDDEAAMDVMRDLQTLYRAGTHHRQFGRTYLTWRRLTEARLRELFIAKGGRPERDSPHYFCLGTSDWFAGLAADTASVSLPLRDLPQVATSATLVDSFGAMGFGPRFGFGAASSEAESAVYLLEELPSALAQRTGASDVAAVDYEGFRQLREAVTQYVEIQLWSDEPIERFLL